MPLARTLILIGAALIALGLRSTARHMGATQGLLSALVAGEAPSNLRGTALGLFHLVVGVVQLIAGAAAGLAWERFGPEPVFACGATCALGALAGLAGRSPSAG